MSSENTIFIKEHQEWRELVEEDFHLYRMVCPINKEILQFLQTSNVPITLVRKQHLPYEYSCNMYQVDVFDDCDILSTPSITTTHEDEPYPVIETPEQSATPCPETMLTATTTPVLLLPNELSEPTFTENIDIVYHHPSPEASSLLVTTEETTSITQLCQEIHNELSKLENIDPKWMEMCGKSFMKFSPDVNIYEIELEKLTVTDLSDIIRNLYHPSTLVKNIPLKAYNVLKSRNKAGLINYIRSVKKIKAC